MPTRCRNWRRRLHSSQSDDCNLILARQSGLLPWKNATGTQIEPPWWWTILKLPSQSSSWLYSMYVTFAPLSQSQRAHTSLSHAFADLSETWSMQAERQKAYMQKDPAHKVSLCGTHREISYSNNLAMHIWRLSSWPPSFVDNDLLLASISASLPKAISFLWEYSSMSLQRWGGILVDRMSTPAVLDCCWLSLIVGNRHHNR